MADIKAQRPAAPQGNPYMPSTPGGPLIMEMFEGIDTTTTRAGVDDKEMWWCDSFMPLGPQRKLRTMYGKGSVVYTAPAGTTISFFDFYNIGATAFSVVFLSNGSVQQVNTATNAVTQIAPAGTIVNPSRKGVGVAQRGSTYLLIIAQQTNGYYIWDGTTLYSPGGGAPDGGTMPTGIGGTAIETYAGRIWIANGATITFSVPGSLHDFSSGNGGGNFTSTDSFLRVGFVALIQTNGFLYLVADSSVNYISGVQTSGSPPTTTFTNQNADPEIGTSWPGTVDVFSRNILFANPFGAHVIYGGAVTKISDKLDGVYASVANFGSFVPSAAKAIIFGKKCWLLLIPIIDPITGQQVNKLFCWNGKIWWAASQDLTLQYVQHQEINSVLTAWGTDGNALSPLFQQPSTAFTKTVQSKLWDKPNGYWEEKATSRFWAVTQYYSQLSPQLTVAIDNEVLSNTSALSIGPLNATWFTAAEITAIWQTVSSGAATWQIAGGSSLTVAPVEAITQNGNFIGMTISTQAADMALVSAATAIDDVVQYRG